MGANDISGGDSLMERGDISNEFAPTIAIDVEGLIFFKRSRFFGMWQQEELNLGAYKVCEHHLMKGRMIYLIAHRDSREEVYDLETSLDEQHFPYTKLFVVTSHAERENILDRKHVHFYYYQEPYHTATRNKRKSRQIYNIAETYF